MNVGQVKFNTCLLHFPSWHGIPLVDVCFDEEQVGYGRVDKDSAASGGDRQRAGFPHLCHRSHRSDGEHF